MEVTPKLKEVISKKSNAGQIKDCALSEGMHTLKMAAAKYVVDGVTSISEMKKITFEA